MSVLLRQRLKYALSGQEVKKICHDKELNIKVDGKARRDHKYPLGLMDVVEIVKTGENFRMLYDMKGRFTPVRIDAKEASFKLCKVKNKVLGKNKIPYIVTHDGRTIRFPHPDIKKNDTVKVSVLSPNSMRKTIIFNCFFSLTCSPARSKASLNSKTSALSSSLVETTSVVLALCSLLSTTPAHTRSSTSRMPEVTPSPPASQTPS
jgi:small subunit ribosomal protein S4e